MELLLSKIKEKKSRIYDFCDIYLFIVIIIIRQLFKHTKQHKKNLANLFFSPFCTPHHTFFQKSHQTTNNKKKRGRASFLFPFSHIASFKFVFQILYYKILILIYLYNIHTLTPTSFILYLHYLDLDLTPSSFIFIT